MVEGKFGGPRPFASSEGSLWLGAITGAEANRMKVEQRLTEIVPDTSVRDIAKDPVTDDSVVSLNTDKAPSGSFDDLLDEAEESGSAEQKDEMMDAIRSASGDVVIAAELPRKRGGYEYETLKDLTSKVVEGKDFGGPVQAFTMAGPAIKNSEGISIGDRIPRPFTEEEYKFYSATIMETVDDAKELESMLLEINDILAESDIPFQKPRKEVIRDNEVVFREAVETDMLMDKLAEEVGIISVLTGIITEDRRFYGEELVEIADSSDLTEEDVEKIGFVSRNN